MKAYQHILAAVDGSLPSRHALEQAFRLPGCRVTAAAVVPPLPGGPKHADPELAARLQAPYEAAQTHCREVAATQRISLETLLLTGEPREALSAAAREKDCDPVVIGKRGQDLPPAPRWARLGAGKPVPPCPAPPPEPPPSTPQTQFIAPLGLDESKAPTGKWELMRR